MPKKIALMLVVLSFSSGFMLMDMLSGVFNDYDDTVETKDAETVYAGSLSKSEAPSVEITGMVLPKKAIRGNRFEMILYLKMTGPVYGSYDIAINLRNGASAIKTEDIRYRMEFRQKDASDEITRIGPVLVSLPENIALGKYRVEVGMTSSDGGERYSILKHGGAFEGSDVIEVVNKYL